jgi:hypothetical protein
MIMNARPEVRGALVGVLLSGRQPARWNGLAPGIFVDKRKH